MFSDFKSGCFILIGHFIKYLYIFHTFMRTLYDIFTLRSLNFWVQCCTNLLLNLSECSVDSSVSKKKKHQKFVSLVSVKKFKVMKRISETFSFFYTTKWQIFSLGEPTESNLAFFCLFYFYFFQMYLFLFFLIAANQKKKNKQDCQINIKSPEENTSWVQWD